MKWRIDLARSAHKALQRAPKAARRRLLAALEEMGADPFSGDIKWLENAPPTLRRRVGSWRIFFELDLAKHVVRVTHIYRRTTTTCKKR